MQNSPERNLLRVIWLWLVVVVVISSPQVSFAYDGQSRTTVAYDSTAESIICYDTASVFATDKEKSGTTERCVPFAKFTEFLAAEEVTTPIGELRAAGLQDAHHVIQDAAVRDLPGYDTQLAPGVQLEGPSTAVGTPHYLATHAQRAAGGGTYAAERDIAANSLRAAGYSEAQIQQALTEADNYFQSIGVNSTTPTRIPGNRRP